ncbi:MAG: protein kinase [Myxococcales bacterium]|nr:protein kinase [Myxococcales bacterium]
MVPEWTCPACGRAVPGVVTPGATCAHDGRVLVPVTTAAEPDIAADPFIGRVIGGQYAVFDRLGRGGMGAVYRAVHRRLGRHVALKTILPDRVDEDAEELHARFELEARLLSELRHPGIVTVYDFGEESGALYMVLELIGGQTLADALRASPRLPLPRAVDIIGQLLHALAEPHRRGLIHRDIKPSNIMLEPQSDGRERVVLIDFGVAKERSDLAPDGPGGPRTRTGVAVGTPRYMAPEQLAHGELGPWTDHYAAGVVLYRMLAGHSPFIGPPAEMIAAHLRDPVPPLPPELGLGALDPVLARAMAKKPAARFADGAAFVEAIEAAVALLPGAAALDDVDDGPMGAQPTMPMAAARPGLPVAGLPVAVPVARATLTPRAVPVSRGTLPPTPTVADPTPSDFSSAWRGAVEPTRAVVAPPSAPRAGNPGRWLAIAALVGVGLAVGLVLVTPEQAAPLERVAAAAPAAVGERRQGRRSRRRRPASHPPRRRPPRESRRAVGRRADAPRRRPPKRRAAAADHPPPIPRRRGPRPAASAPPPRTRRRFTRRRARPPPPACRRRAQAPRARAQARPPDPERRRPRAPRPPPPRRLPLRRRPGGDRPPRQARPRRRPRARRRARPRVWLRRHGLPLAGRRGCALTRRGPRARSQFKSASADERPTSRRVPASPRCSSRSCRSLRPPPTTARPPAPARSAPRASTPRSPPSPRPAPAPSARETASSRSTTPARSRPRSTATATTGAPAPPPTPTPRPLATRGSPGRCRRSPPRPASTSARAAPLCSRRPRPPPTTRPSSSAPAPASAPVTRPAPPRRGRPRARSSPRPRCRTARCAACSPISAAPTRAAGTAGSGARSSRRRRRSPRRAGPIARWRGC